MEVVVVEEEEGEEVLGTPFPQVLSRVVGVWAWAWGTPSHRS